METTTNCAKCNTVLPLNTTDCPVCKSKTPHHNALVTLLLCLFLGLFGAHRFYVKKMGTGLLMLLTLGGLGFWVLIDLLFIVLNKFEDKNGNVIIVSKSNSSLKKAVIVIGAIIYGIANIVLLFMVLVLFATSGLVTTVKDQLDALRSGDFDKAYSYTSKGFQSTVSLDSFKAVMKQHPSFTHNESTYFPTRYVGFNNGVSKGSLEGSLYSTDGKRSVMNYQLIKEDGAWKIEAMNLITELPN